MTDWYINPKEWFVDKEQFEYAKLICEVFNAQEIKGIDEIEERNKKRNSKPKRRRVRKRVNTLYSNRNIFKRGSI